MIHHKNTDHGIMGSIKGWFNDIFEEKYAKEIAIAIIIAAIAAGGYYGYQWFTRNKDEAAHVLFAQNLEEFDRMSQEGKAEDWAAVETLFKLGYDQYPQSSLAPYFLIYQAQALLKQNKFDEAVAAMEKAVAAMPSDSPVLGLYKTKVALMQLDSNHENVVNSGIDHLQKIAADNGNTAQDVAAYHLGLYYWTKNDTKNAKDVWTKLIETTKTTQKLGQSPWAAKAQEKLGQIA